MARNRRNKHKDTTRKQGNACKTDQDVASNSTDDKEFLEALSISLDYFSVNKLLIKLRRQRMFSYERELTLVQKALSRNRRIYIFGSQIEGTTTPKMMSDTDILQRFDTFRLFLDSEKPPFQRLDQQVVIKVSTNGCASQYCVLTMIEPSTQAMRFKQLDPNRDPIDIVECFQYFDWTTSNGMIPHTFMFFFSIIVLETQKSNRHGPAESFENTDDVVACYCKSLPEQCKFVFERPRPGHWPSEETLTKAKKNGVFIVPQGPPKSTNICTYDYFDYQWRISTNLTERLLMFSLDTVHLKAYVLTKMLRKELFMPEYRDNLSTFHFKTAFFFAVETTRPDVWREDNLINCVKCILSTLRRFLTRRNCPHFTIANVNLFDGKIERHEFHKLVDKLTYVMNSLRTKIEGIQMDSIGQTLNEHITRKNERSGFLSMEQSRYCLNGSALLSYVFNNFLVKTNNFNLKDVSKEPFCRRIDLFEKQCTHLEMFYSAPIGKYRKYEYALHAVMSTVAGMGASAFLEQKAEGCEYNHDGINKARQMFIQSLESDIIGNYMRYASFLFCNGEYDEACKYFDLIKKQIKADNKCNLISKLCVSPSESLALQIANQSCEESFKQGWSVFLIFGQAEAMCVPAFLRCEMYRGQFGSFTSAFLLPNNGKEDCICVQIEPYLYYLQYLTYKELHQKPKQSEALKKLLIFIKIFEPARFITFREGTIFLSHFDTSLNMLGHCLEMEQKFELAWKFYKISLQGIPQRNAAVLHIIRLLWTVFQSLPTSLV